MALIIKFGMVLLCLLPLLMGASAQFPWFSPQSLFDQATAQTQAIFNAANAQIAKGIASGNGVASASGVVSNSDGTGYSWVGGTGKDGVFHIFTNKKK